MTATHTDENTAAPAIKNATTLSDVLKKMRAYGADVADGLDAMPKLAFDVVRAAEMGVISTANKTAAGKDDAAKIYEAYREGLTKKIQHHSTDNGKAANESKLRQLLKVGEATHCSGVDLMQDVKEVVEEELSRGSKVKSMYPIMVDAARAQLKAEHQLTRDEIRELAVKKDAETKDLAKKLEAAYRSLTAIRDKEEADLPDLDNAITSLGNAIREAGGEVPQPKAVTNMAKATGVDPAALAAFLATYKKP